MIELISVVIVSVSLLCALISAGLVMVVIWIGYWMLNS